MRHTLAERGHGLLQRPTRAERIDHVAHRDHARRTCTRSEGCAQCGQVLLRRPHLLCGVEPRRARALFCGGSTALARRLGSACTGAHEAADDGAHERLRRAVVVVVVAIDPRVDAERVLGDRAHLRNDANSEVGSRVWRRRAEATSYGSASRRGSIARRPYSVNPGTVPDSPPGATSASGQTAARRRASRPQATLRGLDCPRPV